MDFVKSMIEIILQVFTEYVPGFAKAIGSMFSGLFWVPGVGEAAGSLTILGGFGLGIVGICLVGNLLRLCLSFLPNRLRKSF